MACVVCKESRAAVSCCGQRLCVMDAFVSEHVHHEPRWAICNKAVYNRDIDAARAVRTVFESNLLDIFVA